MNRKFVAKILAITIITSTFLASCSEKKEEKTSSSFEEKTATEGGFSYTYVEGDPIQARTYKLDNGLTVMLSRNDRSPTIQTYVGIRAGSAKDPATATGLAHYLEHMLFKGTSKLGTLDWEKEKLMLDSITGLYEKYRGTKDEKLRTAIYGQIDRISYNASKLAVPNEYDKVMSTIGARGTNAYTWVDQTVYVNNIPSNSIKRWASTEAERFGELTPRLFHTELEAVYEEKNRGLDSDDNKAFEQLMADLFPAHPYGTQTTIGTIDHLKNPSIIEIKKFFDTWYRPNNMVVTLAGDLDYTETMKIIKETFGGLKSQEVPKVTFPQSPELKAPVEHTILGPEAEKVMVSFRTPGNVSNDDAVIDVIQNLISNSGGVGIIDVNLKQQQLVRNPASFWETMNDYGMLVFQASPRDGQTLPQAKDLLLAQVDSLKTGHFPDWLLDAVKLNSKLNQMDAVKDNSTRANYMLAAFIANRPYSNTVKRLDEIQKVTKQQVMDFSKKHFANNYSVIYKKVGKDPNSVQVAKPKITPVVLNRDTISLKLKEIQAIPIAEIKPVFADFSKIEKTELRKGINLFSMPNVTDKLGGISYFYQTGINKDKKANLAYEYLDLLGTSKYSATALKAEFYKLGLSFYSFPGGNSTYFGVQGLDENLDKGFNLLEHFINEAKPDEAILAKLKADKMRERTDAKLDKGTIFFSGVASYLRYGAKNTFNNTFTDEELAKLTSDELLNSIKDLGKLEHNVTYYGPRKATEIAEVFKKEHIAKLQAELSPIDKKTAFVINNDNSKPYFVNYDMVQAEIIMQTNNVAVTEDIIPVQALYNEYFGGDMSSIVFQELRESKALAYSAYARLSEGRPDEKGVFFAYIGSQADKAPEALKSLEEIIQNLPKSPSSFEKAKTAIKNRISTKRWLEDQMIYDYINSLEYNRTKTKEEIIWNGLDKLTLDDVIKYQKENIKGQKYLLGIIADKNKLPKDFKAKYKNMKELSLKDIFGY